MMTSELTINWSNQNKTNIVCGRRGQYKMKVNSKTEMTLPFFS